MQPLWYKDAIFYEVYVRAFADSNGDGHGDLAGLTQRLDYFRDLGVDCLWLLPIYPSPLKDDGYDIADYYGIHPDYGTLDDFKEFLDAAHKRGLRVIADLVLNHTSDQHPWFQAARSDPNSPYRNFYVWSDTDEKYSGARIIFVDAETSNWTWDEEAGQYFWHRFYSSQPDLNYDNPTVRAEMLNVLQFWLDLGVDGFRADAVPYLFEREGTNCENLPETHEFLKSVRRFIDEHYPGRVLLAEANQWPEDLNVYFGEGDEFHMGFHFPLMPRIFKAMREGSNSSIISILARTPPISENCQWCVFLRNHDELTLEMVTPEEREWMWQAYAPEPRMRLNLGIRRRLAPLLDNDRRKIELAHSLLFSMPGSPILYYGDEIGMGDNIWLRDRDGVRTPMQWNDATHAGFTDPDLPRRRLYAPLIDDPVYTYRHINVAAQRSDPGSLWHTLHHMISVRRGQRAFGWGGLHFLEAGTPAVLAGVRDFQHNHILTVHNLSAEAQDVQLNLQAWGSARVTDLLQGRIFPDLIEGAPYPVSLEPYQYLWLKLLPFSEQVS